MKTFEEVYKVVEESSSHAAFNKAECQAMYDILYRMPRMSLIVEIGVQFGRSLSVIAEVSKDKEHSVIGIDNWKEDVSAEAKAHVEAQIKKHHWPVRLINMDSVEAEKYVSGDVGLLHIDGDHTPEGVMRDIVTWVPRLKIGGYICFDDYGHVSLPGVFQSVTAYRESHPGQFEYIGLYGDKLGVFRKL